MHIGRNCPVRKLSLKIFRAQLQTDLRMPLEIDGPFKSLRLKARITKNGHRLIYRRDRDHEIYILSHHRLGCPMIHRDSADSAPRNVGSL